MHFFVYHCDDRPDDHWKSTSGTGATFHLGLNTRKGHREDKYTLKANPYSPQGSYANLFEYVYMCRFSHLSYKLCKYTFTHTSTCWHLQPWLSSTVACEVSNWKRTGCFAAQSLPLSTPQSHPTILISMGYLFYSLQIGSLAPLAEVWQETGRARWWGREEERQRRGISQGVRNI